MPEGWRIYRERTRDGELGFVPPQSVPYKKNRMPNAHFLIGSGGCYQYSPEQMVKAAREMVDGYRITERKVINFSGQTAYHRIISNEEGVWKRKEIQFCKKGKLFNLWF